MKKKTDTSSDRYFYKRRNYSSRNRVCGVNFWQKAETYWAHPALMGSLLESGKVKAAGIDTAFKKTKTDELFQLPYLPSLLN